MIESIKRPNLICCEWREGRRFKTFRWCGKIDISAESSFPIIIVVGLFLRK